MLNNFINACFFAFFNQVNCLSITIWLFIILMLSSSSLYFFSSIIIVIKSSWLISLLINASDILLSTLFNLLLAKIRILLCFFLLFLVVFNSFYKIPVQIENAILKLALANPNGAAITVANDAMGILPVVTDKTINDLSNSRKRQCIY